MNANELRIGNRLLHNGKPKQIGSIHSDNTVRFILEDVRTEGCFNLNNGTISPIPLTPEILIKCGLRCISVNRFESLINKVKRVDSIYTNHIELEESYDTIKIEVIESEDGELRRIGIVDGHYLDATDIKYLHQLQNLVWCLTGKELPIELI